MIKKPRVRIINHHARDESELNMPWERRQTLNDALSHIQRVAGNIPSSITTTNQVTAVKRAVGALKVEIDAVMKLLLEA